MKILFKIAKPVAQVRSYPSTSSEAINILSNDDTIYTGTKLKSGWYYLEEVYGWVQDDDLNTYKVIEPYDPEADIDMGTDDTKPNEGIKYDVNSIIEAFKKSQSKFPSTEVIHVQSENGETTAIPLSTILNTLNNTLGNMNDVINKVDAIPDIPKLLEGIAPGSVLVVDEDGTLVWKKLDFADVENAPSTSDIIGEDEF